MVLGLTFWLGLPLAGSTCANQQCGLHLCAPLLPAVGPSALESGPSVYIFSPSVYRHMWVWVPLAEVGPKQLVAIQWGFMGI